MLAVCGECKKACKAQLVDVGLGPIEYWGALSNDVQLVVASDCCEADCWEDIEDGILIGEIEQIDDGSNDEY